MAALTEKKIDALKYEGKPVYVKDAVRVSERF